MRAGSCKQKIEFRLQEKNGKLIMVIGYLPWPHHIKSVELEDDIVIVHDTKGIAEFCLMDVRLKDLSHD